LVEPRDPPQRPRGARLCRSHWRQEPSNPTNSGGPRASSHHLENPYSQATLPDIVVCSRVCRNEESIDSSEHPSTPRNSGEQSWSPPTT
jgi:hypothetical protein